MSNSRTAEGKELQESEGKEKPKRQQQRSFEVKLALIDNHQFVSYSLKKVLGESFSSIVYGAIPRNRHSINKKRKALKLPKLERIAIKIVNDNNETDNEYFILPRLNHPSVPKLIGCSWSPVKKNWYYGMTLAKGGDLQTWIEKRLPSEKHLAPLFYQLVSAVMHTHESGFVHRDIKLENVFFKDKQQTEVFLGEWGLATPYSQTTILTLDCGTLHYCAPEILDHCPYIGPEVDIWR